MNIETLGQLTADLRADEKGTELFFNRKLI